MGGPGRPNPLARDAGGDGAGRPVWPPPRATGDPLVVLEGSPAYYPRFGFRDCRTLGIEITLPDWAPPEAGMAFPLRAYAPAVRGRVTYPEAFLATGSGR